MFPTPKYRRIKNVVKVKLTIKPCRLFTRIVEKVNNKAKNTRIKNRGIANIKSGSTKYIRKPKDNHTRIVTIKVGKKFFLLIISFFLSEFFIVLFSLG